MPSTRRASAQHAPSDPAPSSSADARDPDVRPSSSATKEQDAASSQVKDEASTDAHIELLTEHFGHNPKAFVDALVYLSNEHLYKLAEQFELFALKQLEDVDGGDLEAEQGVHAILTLLENALDHTLDTFELYCLRSVFGIRTRQAKMMTLEHHRGLDLRPPAGANGTSSKSSRSRKSIAGALTANEKSHRLGTEEDALKRKLAAARATQHELHKAKVAAEIKLSRMTTLQERFSALLSSGTTSSDDDADGDAALPDIGPIMTSNVAQHARKLRADTQMLLKNLAELRSADPLGKPLAATGAAKESGSGDEEAAADPRAWEEGREAYLNWEAERIMANSKRKAAGEVDGEESIFAEDEAKTPRRRKAAASKRKSTSSSAATAKSSSKRPHLDDDGAGSMASTVGQSAEMDKIASTLKSTF